ncbi:benzoylformate decarboxylase [Comamonas sp. E6]|uniref:benzoylformate decarboxylase n=1 Tax=Comamonas sp. E6 TaxID=364029 RepID=UPI0006306791|nr:benzoylformate decarboxylase [Comamonas sp. E6]GAO71278.1 benzoylformate decarboxylase [Comamonas sp. E6]
MPANTAPNAQAAEVFTVRHAVINMLRELGMTRIFGNPGSTELPLFRDYPEDFSYILGLQETVVVGMADGYAQATRNASFVNLHSAAGVGHAMANIFTAFKNRTPMVITAGQQTRSLLQFDPFLHSNQAAELPKPYVKWSCEPARAEDVPQALARAYYIAMQEPRGPVFVSIPADDWDVPCEPITLRKVGFETRPDPRLLDSIGQALESARTPAFVVGAAVDRSQAFEAVQALAERHQARVYVAPMSGRCGFPEDHALFGGFLPAMRERIVDRLSGHDVVFVIGAPAFTYHVEGHGPFIAEGTQLFQLIEDPAIAAWAPVGDAAVGNIRMGVQELLARPLTHPRPALQPRPAIPAPAAPEPGELMSDAFLMHTLAQVRSRDSIIVEEAPGSRSIIQAHLPIYATETFFTMCSGGLGHSLPASVGIALAKPDKKVIGVIGDGSAMYAIQALWSAAHLKLPVTYIIVKNRRYAALQDFSRVFGYREGEKVEGTDLPDIDFVALAKGQGCDGVRVTEAAQLPRVLRDALRSPRATLVEVEVA